MIVLIVVSFQFVEVGFYGLDANYIVQQVDLSKVYDEGRYFVGIGHGFVTFPKTIQTLEFADDNTVVCRTRDGLALTLAVTLQYEIIRDSIPLLWEMSNLHYVESLTNVGRDVIRDVSSLWRAVEFFHNRSSIELHMRTALTAAFEDFYMRCNDLQLKSIDLPDRFESAIEETEVARQDIEKARFELTSSQVLAQTRIMYAEVNRTIAITSANATAQALLVQVTASAQGLNMTTTATADAAAILAATAGLTPSQLVNYMYIQALGNVADSRTVVGLDQPVDLSTI